MKPWLTPRLLRYLRRIRNLWASEAPHFAEKRHPVPERRARKLGGPCLPAPWQPTKLAGLAGRWFALWTNPTEWGCNKTYSFVAAPECSILVIYRHCTSPLLRIPTFLLCICGRTRLYLVTPPFCQGLARYPRMGVWSRGIS